MVTTRPKLVILPPKSFSVPVSSVTTALLCTSRDDPISNRPPFQFITQLLRTTIGPVRLPPFNVRAKNCELVLNVTFPELITAVSVLVGTWAGFQFALLVHSVEAAPVHTIGVLMVSTATWLVAAATQ